MTLLAPKDTVMYRSRLNPKINRNFEIFTPTDFLAAITQHIPDKSAQMIRYYGWYSNKMRGQRHMAANGGIAAEPLRPASTPACKTAIQEMAGCDPKAAKGVKKQFSLNPQC